MSRRVEVVIQLFPLGVVGLRVLLHKLTEQHQAMAEPFGLFDSQQSPLSHPTPSPQIGPISGNHLLVPPEGFLARAGEGTVAVVVAVDVNQAVAFAHFAG